MTDNCTKYFIIGKDNSDFLKVEVLNYVRPDLSDYWEANWIFSRINIKAGSFSADYIAQLQTTDFREFKKGLDRLYNDLKSATQFYSLEDWLTIIISGDGLGHFKVDCKACDLPGRGNRLEFKMHIDQTEIPSLVKQLSEILDKFPVKGRPDNAKK
jgi:hypothetical protein